MNNDPAAAIAGLLLGLICGLAIGLPIGAVILRAAISLANKMLGPKSQELIERSSSSSPSGFSSSDPFAAPQTQTVVKTAGAVPEPDFGKALLVALVTMVCNFVVSFMVGLATGFVLAGTEIRDQAAITFIAQLASLPFSFLTIAAVRTFMLPTTFGRGALVTLFEFLIVIAVVAVIVGVMALVLAVIG